MGKCGVITGIAAADDEGMKAMMVMGGRGGHHFCRLGLHWLEDGSLCSSLHAHSDIMKLALLLLMKFRYTGLWP